MVATLMAIGVAVLVGLAVIVRQRGDARAARSATVLRWLTLALTVVLAAVLAPDAVSDASWFAAVLLGVPVVLAVLPVLVDVTGRRAGPVTAVCAALMLGWGLLLGLGPGLYFVLPGLLLGVAAAASTGAGRAGSRR